jgi:hypothetical protein
MEITDPTAIRSHLAVRNYDRLIMLGYVAITIVAIAVLYIASSGPGSPKPNSQLQRYYLDK